MLTNVNKKLQWTFKDNKTGEIKGCVHDEFKFN